ncbi:MULTISPECIES: hypothetical protein [Actinosynnema]|uniref:hypothetical protein n=1 Tax=Actinosynnema TaxID=40566 RepID=UPI0020A4FC6A|nr:hypothetical protein [Actinosynnema pretiosum]MCP2097497.1 hypothetical protein [Actinosynnema pretiosum]
MAESTKSGRGRTRRSTRVSRQLELARQRNAAQLARQREQEQAVEQSLQVFFDAADQQVAAEEDCRQRIEPHERAIAQLREQRDRVLAQQERNQALAALAIHEADRTVEQVAELLGLGEKAARRLIAVGRAALAEDAAAEQAADGTQPSGLASGEVAQGRRASARHDAPVIARPTAPDGPVGGAQTWPGEPTGGLGGSEAATIGA